MPGRFSRRLAGPAIALLGILTATALLAAPTAVAAPQQANPASQNCIAKGGTLVMANKPEGGQYGICMFEDNRECEEWALLRGQCRDGGIKVTGYATAAARYCAITGGAYTVTGASNTPAERGNCALPDGRHCAAASYYEGSCAQTASTNGPATGAGSSPQRIQAKFSCANGKSIDATFINGKGSRVQLAISDGRRMSLPQALSADGGRYANADESIVFWNTGNTAFVQEHGTTTYANCATK